MVAVLIDDYDNLQGRVDRAQEALLKIVKENARDEYDIKMFNTGVSIGIGTAVTMIRALENSGSSMNLGDLARMIIDSQKAVEL